MTDFPLPRKREKLVKKVDHKKAFTLLLNIPVSLVNLKFTEKYEGL